MFKIILQMKETLFISTRHISFYNRQLFQENSFNEDEFTKTLNYIEENVPHGVPRERSINDVTLLGRVGRDPVLVTSMDYKSYARFSLATRSPRAHKERGTDWHEIVCYEEQLKEYIVKYIKRGDRLFIQGTINYLRPPPEFNTPYNKARIIARKILIANRKYHEKDEDSDS